MPSKFRDILLPLVEYTTPHKTEDSLEPQLPKPFVKDDDGNYVIDVGDHKGVMFSSHLDTACQTREKIGLRITEEGRLHTDGKTILGADCKAGAALMLWMIQHGIPGHYVFHAGEERGGIGSHARAEKMAEWYKANIRKCIAFDRRAYHSIITRQGGDCTASDDFAKSLIEQVPSMKIDPTGSFTDSKSYAHLVPECTNLSVGYHNEHSCREWLSIPYLEWLSKVVLRVKWGDLVVARTPEEPKWKRGVTVSSSPTKPDATRTTTTGGAGYLTVGTAIERLPWNTVDDVEKWNWDRRLSLDKDWLSSNPRLIYDNQRTGCFMVMGRPLAGVLEKKGTLSWHRLIASSSMSIEVREALEKKMFAEGRAIPIKPTKRERFGFDPYQDEIFLLNGTPDRPALSLVWWSELNKTWCVAKSSESKKVITTTPTTWKEALQYV